MLPDIVQRVAMEKRSFRFRHINFRLLGRESTLSLVILFPEGRAGKFVTFHTRKLINRTSVRVMHTFKVSLSRDAYPFLPENVCVNSGEVLRISVTVGRSMAVCYVVSVMQR